MVSIPKIIVVVTLFTLLCTGCRDKEGSNITGGGRDPRIAHFSATIMPSVVRYQVTDSVRVFARAWDENHIPVSAATMPFTVSAGELHGSFVTNDSGSVNLWWTVPHETGHPCISFNLWLPEYPDTLCIDVGP